uniref:Leucine Rich Repeat family protein n=1 Tax=Wuchereria bancrofti TaxID=6293 RepID=A0A1I8EC71_WUCBA
MSLPYVDSQITSRYSISEEQLIPRPTKVASTLKLICSNVAALHPCRQGVEAWPSVTCANIYSDNDHGEGSGTSDYNIEEKGRRMNSSRYNTAMGRCYDNEIDDVHGICDEDNSDKSYHDDDKSVDNTQEWRRIRICENERRRQRRKLTRYKKRQWLVESDTITQFTGTFVLFVSIMQTSLACPEIITSICRCDDSQNGIILQCSHTDGSQVVYMLKANQINLGLIQQLEMQDSGLKHIPAGFFSGLFIKKLDLSYNSIVDIDENSFLGMNDVLQELMLHHNNLTQLPSKALTPLSALLRLNLSNNSIGDIEAEHAFPPLSKLYDISLANNRICQIHKNAFDGVKHSIQTINLGRNCLKKVPASAVRGFKQLMALHLHNNNISALEALSFMNLPLINLLNLASNQISTIHNRAFLNVPNLRYLYLTRNRITNILPHLFGSFEQLEMLDLTGNHLTELQENSFSNLKNLRQLYLGENHIERIKPGTFINSSVVILILNSNRLEKLHEGMFDGLTKLQQLALKDNQIQFIDQNSFYSNQGLAMLDLSNNKLVDIPPSTFLAQINLFLIDLSGNRLERTPYEAFSRQVKIVLLQENPLVCSEGVHMLQQGVGIYIASSEDAICGLHKNPNPNSTGITDATNTPPTSTYFMMDNRKDGNFKHEELLLPKSPPVIRPVSSIENEANKPETSVREQEKIRINEVIPVRPVNASVNIQPNLPLQSSEMFSTEQLMNAMESRVITIPESRKSGTRRYEDKVSNYKEMRTRDRSYQHPFDTNTVHPFPVPFLKSPTKLSEAYAAVPGITTITDLTSANNITSSEQTLPPSILIANHVQKFDHTTPAQKTDRDHTGKNSMENMREAQESGEILLERVTAPSVIILICLSTVAIVMAAVLIGLCIAKHRRLQTCHGSMTTDSAARTNAYVAAQLDMIYGTVRRDRNAPILNRFDDGQPWIYAPASYGTAAGSHWISP